MDVEGLLAIQRSSFQRATPAFRRGWPESDALTHDGLAALLERHLYCVLATSRADARAHAAPVAYVVHEGAFWFATVAGLRLQNLVAHPWAALVVMEGEADVGEAGQPHIALTAEGPTKLHEIGDWRLFENEWLRRHTDPPTWAAALVELRPERLFSHAAPVDA
jgi:Pyridoxamine 5'-phosphate oxidase